jgi:folate-dependent phosphoribosylglycinamide formyltransferase PurN
MSQRLRVVTLTCASDPQKHLVSRLAKEHELAGWVSHGYAAPPRSRRLARLVSGLAGPYRAYSHLLARRENAAVDAALQPLWRSLFHEGGEPPRFPGDVPHVHTGDVNAAAAVSFVRERRPDVIVVNGTNLLRAPMLEAGAACRYGILNIHTGLSPYTRGGNCNLHSILHRQVQCVGVTVHYIDPGIDSGDIVLTGRPPVTPEDTFESLDAKTFRLGEELLVTALEDLREGTARRVRQWTPGRLFLKRTGYEYAPGLRSAANRILREEDLLGRYLRHRDVYDETVAIVTTERSRARCPVEGSPCLR